jgi:tetratricopeptide (TPR) repeat protein
MYASPDCTTAEAASSVYPIMTTMRSFAALALALVTATALPFAQRPATAPPERAGWDALNAGRPREAAAAFDEALRRAPRDPLLLLGAAVAAHLLGDADSARRYLVDALRQDPTLTSASLLLGDILYRADDLNGAIQVYEQAAAHAPGDRLLQSRLENWRKEAALHDRFARKLTDHFTVLFEGPAEAELAAKALEILEAAYWRIGSTLYTYPTDVVTVVLYTREQFRDVTRAPDWAGGAYDGRIRVPVLGALNDRRAFERVLAHEFTHALVKTLSPRGVPQWLNEGLAMYFEGADLTPLVERVRAAESRHSLAALERPFIGMNDAAAALAYAQSAAAVKLLMDEAGAPAIVGLLTELGRAVPFGEAFERHTNMTYAEFQKR